MPKGHLICIIAIYQFHVYVTKHMQYSLNKTTFKEHQWAHYYGQYGYIITMYSCESLFCLNLMSSRISHILQCLHVVNWANFINKIATIESCKIVPSKLLIQNANFSNKNCF